MRFEEQKELRSILESIANSKYHLIVLLDTYYRIHKPGLDLPQMREKLAVDHNFLKKELNDPDFMAWLERDEEPAVNEKAELQYTLENFTALDRGRKIMEGLERKEEKQLGTGWADWVAMIISLPVVAVAILFMVAVVKAIFS